MKAFLQCIGTRTLITHIRANNIVGYSLLLSFFFVCYFSFRKIQPTHHHHHLFIIGFFSSDLNEQKKKLFALHHFNWLHCNFQKIKIPALEKKYIKHRIPFDDPLIAASVVNSASGSLPYSVSLSRFLSLYGNKIPKFAVIVQCDCCHNKFTRKLHREKIYNKKIKIIGRWKKKLWCQHTHGHST